ncbi:hypothetical protein CA13_08630 [Planctomycetes bacterium CA13]|uniref:Uncharacterized protein n=1 Tax=Novipirellula herctigrandis TaxID=2527986 RepID=A0A5C5YWS5_9BACT|nr:hypothetical protein CA13_08630 [Planctomycetes bacterium CA13]
MSRFYNHVGILFLAIFATQPCGFTHGDVAAEEPAEDRDYYSIDVGELIKDFDKTHIVSDPEVLKPSFYQMETTPRVVVPIGSEAYLIEPEDRNNEYRGYRIVGAKPKGVAVDGQFYLLRRHPDHPRDSSLAKFDFHIDETSIVPCDSSDFHQAKGRHFQLFWSTDYAGSAMFRHLAIESLKKVGETATPIGPNWPLRRRTGIDDTIQLVSGGRAVSENLQLDRELAGADSANDELQDLADVEGITVREINWTRRLSKEPTELDPLAAIIPHDQYAVFVPSFTKLTQIIDRSSELARPIVQWFEPQSQTTNVLGFYQDQLGLPLDALTRQVGEALIDEVVVTGSDPYFRTGTDVAVLMQTSQPALLHQALLAQVALQASRHDHVKRIDHQVNDHLIAQWSNQRRDFCSLVAVVDDAVIVSNSIAQMMAILNTVADRSTSMMELDEYKFFRQRYRRGSEAESALIIVTDAAIRRWCGPKWRISASRRTRARASVAEISMQNADALVRKTVQGETQIHIDSNMHAAGALTLTSAGVQSDRYGTLDFQTPIVELDLKTATAGEVGLYVTWRDRYQRRWRNVFDPIALKLSLSDDAFAADLSVIPLMLGTQYRTWQSLIGDIHLKPHAGDRHEEELLSFVMALDLNAPQFQFVSAFLGGGTTNVANGNLRINILSWIDNAVHLYVDLDEAWIQRMADRSPWQRKTEDMAKEFPIGVFFPSKDSLKQAMFVAAVRGFFERSAPNLVRWDLIQYKEIEFAKATAADSTPIGNARDLPNIYYVTTPDGLTVSFNENVIRRAIDRHLQRKENASSVDIDEEKSTQETAFESQLKTHISGTGAEVLSSVNSRSGMNRMHRLSWGNIPILNYLRHRYPDREPKEVYRQLFGQTLIEPSGGQYEWDDQIQSYVSTLQGYHLDPKKGPVLGLMFNPTDVIETSLSFQDEGLRATMQLKSGTQDEVKQ